MTKNLVIVESPAKARTIERYLGDGYRVLASLRARAGPAREPRQGQARRRRRARLRAPVRHQRGPPQAARRHRRAAASSDRVYLATDLDREGEAIAWHIVEAVDIPDDKRRRVTFSEITQSAIREAFEHPRDIDMDLVDAQQTRRIMDRLVGYTLSPLISRKVRSGLSAGRVQSVAVRLVVEREREIEAFAAREYWTLDGRPAHRRTASPSRAALVRVDGQAIARGGRGRARTRSPSPTRPRPWPTRTSCAARTPPSRVTGPRRSKRNPAPPVHDEHAPAGGQPQARLRAASARCRWRSGSTRASRSTASPPGSSPTCAPTRSTWRRSAKAEAHEVVADRFGPSLRGQGRAGLPQSHARAPRRPTRPSGRRASRATRSRSRARVKDGRAAPLPAHLAARAGLADGRQGDGDDAARSCESGRFGLRASATRTTFDGFTRVYTEGRDDGADDEAEGRLPELAEGETARVEDAAGTQHFTEPPPRFTEATLIKALEEHGIGRPSTYAATISTIVDRGYVTVKERRLYPEVVADIVTDVLVEHFGDYVDVDFTARMEEELDEVARGRARVGAAAARVLRPAQGARRREAPRAAPPRLTTEATDEVCSEGHPMVIRLGRNGRFLACSLYPEHKETRPLPGEEPELPAVEGVGQPCPKCGEGTLVAKRGRFGVFAGCSRYPDCDYIHRTGPPPPPQLPFEVECPRCGQGTLTARRARRTGSVFYGCSRYPDCDFTTSLEPLGALHDADAGAVARKGDGGMCLRCGASVELPDDGIDAGGPAPGRRPSRPRGAAALPRAAAGGSTARARGARAARGRRHVIANGRGRPRGRPPRRPEAADGLARSPWTSGGALRTGAAAAGGVPRRAAPRATRRRTPCVPTARRCRSTSTGSRAEPIRGLQRVGLDWWRPPRRSLRAYLAELDARGLARTTIASRVAALRSFYRFARRQGWVAGDPWAAVVTPRRASRLPRVLEVEEVERLLDGVAGSGGNVAGGPRRDGAGRRMELRDRAIVETAYAAGLRISELAGARLADVDLARGEMRVLGKGRKERIGMLGAPARDALEAYLRMAAPCSRVAVAPLPRRPATRSSSAPAGQPLGPRASACASTASCGAPAFPERTTPHTLRHSFAVAPARRRRGPARRPGAARARQPGARPRSTRTSAPRACGPATAPRIRAPRGPRAARTATTRRTRPTSPRTRPRRARPRRAHRHRRLPRLAHPGLGPRRRPRQPLRRQRRAGRLLRRPSASPTSSSSSSRPGAIASSLVPVLAGLDRHGRAASAPGASPRPCST